MLNSDTDIYKVLVVEDNHSILRLVKLALEQAGYDTTAVASGEAALEHIKRHGLPHIAVVDINMPPGMDGFEFCEAVHEFSDLPVVMLTAIDNEEVVIEAIEQHAEDYITKPFRPGELVARVGRVLRRVGDFAYALGRQIQVDDRLSVDFAAREVVLNGEEVSLTPTEAKLLYILMRNAGQIVTANFVIRRLWPMEGVQEDRLRVYVHRLRKKIEKDSTEPYYIHSERGIGYMFVRGTTNE
ncbi:MAG: response regulator transcription factor [Chloroflexota bacterium]|jgi:DNA-binding response OmpR family regulator